MSALEQRIVSYRNTYGDFVAFMWRHNTRQPVVLALGAIFLVFSSLIWARATWSGDDSAMVKIFTFIILEALTLAAWFIIVSVVTFLSNVSRMNRSFLTEHTITIDSEGLTEATEFGLSQWKWPGIQKVVKSKSYLLLYVSQHSAHVIPKRAFDSDESWESFYGAVMQFKRNSA